MTGDLTLTLDAPGVVVMSQASGNARHSPRCRQLAEAFWRAGLGTLMIDLLTPQEHSHDQAETLLHFDVDLLSQRLCGITHWLQSHRATRGLDIGLFASGTVGGAALMAAATLGGEIGAVACRQGRPDLAGNMLPLVRTPTLLLVDAHDNVAAGLNEMAYVRLRCEKALHNIPRAEHLQHEAKCEEAVATLCAPWFQHHLVSLNEFEAAIP